MKKPIPAPVIAAIIIVFVAVIGYFGYRAISPPPAQLNHAYTPGMPPWLDPKMKDQSQANGGQAAPPGAPAGTAPNAAPGAGSNAPSGAQ